MMLLCGLVVYLCSSHTCWSFAINTQPVLEFSTMIAILIYMLSFIQDNNGCDTQIISEYYVPLPLVESFSDNYAPHLYGRNEVVRHAPDDNNTRMSSTSSNRSHNGETISIW